MKYHRFSREDIRAMVTLLATKFYRIDPKSEIVAGLIALRDCMDEMTENKPIRFNKNRKVVMEVIEDLLGTKKEKK